MVTVIFLALAFHALEITLETAVESKSRLSTEFSLEKLRAQIPIVTEERKLFSSLLSRLRTFLLKQMFSGEIGRLTRRGAWSEGHLRSGSMQCKT